MPLPFSGAICIRCAPEQTHAIAIRGNESVELVGFMILGALIGCGLWLYFIT
jgi:hypothetical protein